MLFQSMQMYGEFIAKLKQNYGKFIANDEI